MEQKINYHQQLLKIIEDNQKLNKKPTLLLHACCGPCSSYVIEFIAKYFDITILYYNPNIYPPEEYHRRFNELKNFLPRFPEAISNNVKLIEDTYEPQDFYNAIDIPNNPQLATEKEKGQRCRRCYKLRLERAHQYALDHDFDYFTTTLSISPYKDSKMLNEIGYIYINEKKARYLPADFKKNSGFLRSTQISKEYDLWRQDYCGCVFSKQNMHSSSQDNSSKDTTNQINQ